MASLLHVDEDALPEFCRRRGMGRLALFGSVSRGEQTSDSDIELLIEFEPGRIPGLLRLAAMELERGRLFGTGRSSPEPTRI